MSDVIIVRANVFLHPKELTVIREHILKQKEEGVVVLPPIFDVITAPEDVEIQFDFDKEKGK